MLSVTEAEAGGYKEIIFTLEGDGVYREMKFESGVHRVQRVPATEASGRIHTSAATVAVLPEVEEVDVEVGREGPARGRLPRRRPGWAGGQHHRLRRAHHAPAHRAGRDVPGRAVADQEPREGHEGAARAALRPETPRSAAEAGRDAQVTGLERRSQCQDPHVQLPAEPCDGPPHRPHTPLAPDFMAGDIAAMTEALLEADAAERLASHGGRHGLTRVQRGRNASGRPPATGALQGSSLNPDDPPDERGLVCAQSPEVDTARRPPAGCCSVPHDRVIARLLPHAVDQRYHALPRDVEDVELNPLRPRQSVAEA